MKIFIQIAIALVLLGLLAGCTQNDEWIGNRFGQWKLTEITIDGEPDASYQGNVFWAFQTGIIQMKRMRDNGAGLPGVTESFGGCREEGNTLILDYRNTDSEHFDDLQYYSPLPEMLMPDNSVITLKILTLTGSRMVVEYTDADGREIVYYLTKWN